MRSLTSFRDDNRTIAGGIGKAREARLSYPVELKTLSSRNEVRDLKKGLNETRFFLLDDDLFEKIFFSPTPPPKFPSTHFQYRIHS